MKQQFIKRFCKNGCPNRHLVVLFWKLHSFNGRLQNQYLNTFYRPERCVDTWVGAEPHTLPTRNSLHNQGETPLGGSEVQQAARVPCAWCDGQICPLLRLLDPPVWSVHADGAAPRRSLPRGAARAPGRSWFSSPGSAPRHASPCLWGLPPHSRLACLGHGTPEALAQLWGPCGRALEESGVPRVREG